MAARESAAGRPARVRLATIGAIVLLVALGGVQVSPVLAGGPWPAQSFPPSGSPGPGPSAGPSSQPTPSPSSPSSSPSSSPAGSPASSPAAASGVPTLLPTPRALPSVSPIAPIPPVQVQPGSVTFYGRGYGHGLGLSQYGARGRALAGQSAATILAHYYQGTTAATADPAAPIRVLVYGPSSPTAAKPIVLHGRGAPFTIDGFNGSFPIGARLAVWRSGSGFGISVRSAGGSLLLSKTTPTADLRVRSGAEPGRIQVDSQPSSFDTYRATIRILGTSKGVLTVNEIGLDLYLRGVVPAEMPAGWPIEALKAQTIAARSYAEQHVHVGIGAYDLFNDTRSQVYRGALGEVAAATAAVTATAGGVLKSGSAIINALYHSADGGATENNENVFTSATGQIVSGPLSYLRGSPDRDPNGVSYDSTSPHAKWQTAAYTYAQLSAILATDSRTNVGALTGIDLADKGVSGRPIKIVLSGSLGSKSVSAEVFRDVFNSGSPAADPYMWSTLFDTVPIP
jgi:stage II sporulation protein D